MSPGVSVIIAFLDSNDEFAKNYFSEIFNSIQATMVETEELLEL